MGLRRGDLLLIGQYVNGFGVLAFSVKEDLAISWTK